MESKLTLGVILTLIAVSVLGFAVAGFFTAFITRGAFAGITILGCLLFFAGITLLSDQLSHK
jgi:uncharacterized membrane protein